MRIATWNVNGLRSALRKGFAGALERLSLDALMLQEIRALPSQLPPEWQDPEGWNVWWHPAEKKGYAGTATWTRQPLNLLGLGFDGPDVEGRILRAQAGGIDLINIYLPSGSSGPDKQANKNAFLDRLLPWAANWAQSPHPVILAGDLNIAHTENDIHNPKGNANNSGFLPHERAWFTKLLTTGWTDALRHQLGDQQGPYTWWSNRGRARELDRGWRIDYLLCNAAAAARVTQVSVHREYGLTVSDHAPVVLTLD